MGQTMSRIRLLWLLALILVLPACAAAQQGTSDSVHIRNQCRLATQIVTTGNPEPHATWAYEQISRCGAQGGAAVAAAIRSARQLSDTDALDRITGPALYLVDGQVVGAALDIVEDRAATKQARVFAFRTLILAVSPGRVLTYEQLSGRDCFGLPRNLHHEIERGAPLPADFRERIRSAAEMVGGDAEAAPEVHRAAVCTTLHLLRA
jgi:hypothetical protein